MNANTEKREKYEIVSVQTRQLIGNKETALYSSPIFQCVAIIGVGLMGGSLGMALRAKGIAQTVVGIDTVESTLTRAQKVGAIDMGTANLRQGVADADCVVLAAPVAVIPPLLETLVPLVRPDALITDIGSAKRQIVDAGERCFGKRFVGGHPMAGAPNGGIDAARADVFGGAAWGIVGAELPDVSVNSWAAKLAGMALALDARPVLLDSAQHDRLVALVSHLPHILSFAFADMIAEQTDAQAAYQMAGSSFRDMTRVAVADRAFWQAIFQANRDEALTVLKQYEACLQEWRQALENN